jgi:lipopolysaccharide transport system permease protein
MVQRTVITPENTDSNYWKDVWRFRGLCYFLAWRDVLVRYKQTAIGIAWSVLRPALTIGVFWFIGWFFKIPDEGVPRIIMVTAATLPWQFFSSAFSEAANSLISNQNLLTKVYFPRIIVPVSTVIVCLIDFLISFAILVVIMIFLRYTPGWQIMLLPFFLVLALLTAMGSGLFIAALNVKYRDFRYVIPFIVQFGLYVSPIAFSSNTIFASADIPDWAKVLYALNPMVGVIDGFRWCITGGEMAIATEPFAISMAITALMLVVGVRYFRRMEKSFADVI